MSLIKTSLESAIDLIRNRFLKKMWEVRSSESVNVRSDIRRCLAVGTDADRLKRAYELLESALGRWRESFARVAEESFRELCSLASAHPEWLNADPIGWARTQIDALMAEELDGALSHDVQWNAQEPRPLVAGTKPGRHLEWYMLACEGSDYVLPRDSAGQTKVWLAPSWVSGRPVLNRPWSDEPTTQTETNSVLRQARSDFEHRARYVLDDAVDKARIEIACRPLSGDREKSQRKKPGSARRTSRKDGGTRWREWKIYLAIGKDLWGEDYCAFLEEEKAKPRPQWHRNTYPEAYRDRDLRRLISKERDRIRRLMKKGWVPDLISENRVGSADPLREASSVALRRLTSQSAKAVSRL